MTAIPGDDDRGEISAAEWQVRVDLAACYRLIALYGWDDLVFNHISARVPDSPEEAPHFLVNAYGLMFDEITASNLIKVDQQSMPVEETLALANGPGFFIHSAIHMGRPDVQCVLDVHTTDGVAVSGQREGLLPLSQQAIIALASIAYHDYEGIPIDDAGITANIAEGPRLVRDLGNCNNLIMRNHGLLTVGQSVAAAFLAMFNLQRACEIQIKMQSAQSAQSQSLRIIDSRIIENVVANLDKVIESVAGQIAWPALLRKLDRIDPGYRK